MTLHRVNRRHFMKNASKIAAAFTGASYLALPRRVFGANDRIRVAVVGIHGQGNAHITSFHRQPGAEVIALCDVDENVLRVSIGTGITWRSPFGPIAVDLAYPIKKESYDKEEFFRFSVGTRF